MSAPCIATLLRHSRWSHDRLREVMGDGRCPICDPSVTRAEYAAVIEKLMRNPATREAVRK